MSRSICLSTPTLCIYAEDNLATTKTPIPVAPTAPPCGSPPKATTAPTPASKPRVTSSNPFTLPFPGSPTPTCGPLPASAPFKKCKAPLSPGAPAAQTAISVSARLMVDYRTEQRSKAIYAPFLAAWDSTIERLWR